MNTFHPDAPGFARTRAMSLAMEQPVTRPKGAPAKPNGRPHIQAYDSLSKACRQCGKDFFLRDKHFQSYGRFMKRKFCSLACHGQSMRATSHGNPELFWSRVAKAGPNECWEWQGRCSPKGYGYITVAGVGWRVHRYAYHLVKGTIPDGLMILHSCDNRRCCNPDHLRPGTARENYLDAVSRNRVARQKKRVDRSDPRIFRGTLAEAARATGVSPTTIWKIRKGVAK